MPFVARMLIRWIGIALALAVIAPDARRRLQAAPPPQERLVYLARDLPDENLIVLGSALAERREDSVLLLDSSKASPYLKAFLTAYRPTRVIPVGGNPGDADELERRLGIKTDAPVTWTRGPATALWRS